VGKELEPRKIPAKATIVAPRPLGAPAAVDKAEALKVMTDVWKNEETRFSNLNTRGVAVVSAASLVTTILGVFTKNVLDSTTSHLTGSPRTVALIGICTALLVLVVTIGIIVFGVLAPGRRVIFGDNALTRGQAVTAEDIDALAYSDYAAIYADLANRSLRKAYWLTAGYCSFFIALTVSAAATAYIVLEFNPVT
jgi:hypothetical protein